MIGPAPILAAIVGLFHVSAYVFIRGQAGARLPFLLIASVLGASAGDAVGSRLAVDPLRLGEFNLTFASIMAWLAIGLVALLAILVPERGARRERVPVTTSGSRRGSGPGEPVAEPSVADRSAAHGPEPELQVPR